MNVQIACCQIAPNVDDPAGSVAAARQAIAAAVAEGAQIVLLPELANSGYVFRSIEEVRAAAVPADDDVLASWAREAARGDAIVVSGFCERASDGRVYNSVALLDGSGVLVVYRKLQLRDGERRPSAAGEQQAPVTSTSHSSSTTTSSTGSAATASCESSTPPTSASPPTR
jgi:predicted amidohydrolase